MQFTNLLSFTTLITLFVIAWNAESKVSKRREANDDASGDGLDYDTENDDAWAYTLQPVGESGIEHMKYLLSSADKQNEMNRCLQNDHHNIVIEYKEPLDSTSPGHVLVTAEDLKTADIFKYVLPCALTTYGAEVGNFNEQFFLHETKIYEEIPDWTECDPEDYKCHAYGQCISNDLVCNERSDCYDGSDETECGPFWAFTLDVDEENDDRREMIMAQLERPENLDELNLCLAAHGFRAEMKKNKDLDVAYFRIVQGDLPGPATLYEQVYQCTKLVFRSYVQLEFDKQFRFSKVKYGEHPSYLSCRSDQFRCNYGQCIPSSKYCDGTNHCYDGSDELCQARVKCQDYQFTCFSQTQCIDLGRECDGIPDCADGSDESICEVQCTEDEFRCSDRRQCINRYLTCNNRRDCKDGSDEWNCGVNLEYTTPTLPPPPTQHDCGPHEFVCHTDASCIPLEKQCNYHPDCLDGSDERNCPAPVEQCDPQYYFTCRNGQCVHKSQHCDRQNDCVDESDEEQCGILASSDSVVAWVGGRATLACYSYAQPPIPITWTGPSAFLPGHVEVDSEGTLVIRRVQASDSGEYKCSTNDYSASIQLNVNGDDTDDEDRIDIEGEIIATQSNVNRNTPDTCDGPNTFRCANDLCLDISKQCDRNNDCYDNSDETYCDVRASPGKIKVRVGSDAAFECSSSAFPPIPVSWSRKGYGVLPPNAIVSQGRLFFRDAHPSDSGEYICTAGAYSRTVLFDVEQRQAPPVYTDQPSYYPDYGNCSLDRGMFRCYNGQCISAEFRCDGDFDCADQSDEAQCVFSRLCEPDEFRCEKKCISKIWQCDGDHDCGDDDHSDEAGCDKSITSSGCQKDEFACSSDNMCIPLGFQCDKAPDCRDGSDESGCIVPIVRHLTPLEVRGQTNEKVILSCEARGIGAPIIVWRLNWGKINDPPRVTVDFERMTPYKKGSNMVVVKSTLTIHSLTQDDEGAYSCQGINNAGEIFAIPDVIVHVEPSTLCKPPYFNALAQDQSECKTCWCSGVTNRCKSSELFYMPEVINSDIHVNPQAPTHEFSEPIFPGAEPNDFFRLQNLPRTNLLSSYGGYITYLFYHYLSTTPDLAREYGLSDPTGPFYAVKIEGNGQSIYSFIDTFPPSNVNTSIRIKLEESNWFSDATGRYRVSRDNFLKILSNVEAIYINQLYAFHYQTLRITDIQLWSASYQNYGLGRAVFVEVCQCPEGYTGLSCESCDHYYKRDSNNQCVSICTCNDHSKICYESAGNAICQNCLHHTEGDHCDRCAPGYHGDATRGTPYDCEPCDCPRSPDGEPSSCHHDLNQVYCDQCPPHSFGVNCEKCHDGYIHKDGHCYPDTTGRGCLPGQFQDENGQCVNCFCFGAANECSGVTYNRQHVRSSFDYSSEENDGFQWAFEDPRLESDLLVIQPGPEHDMIHIRSDNADLFYWILPPKFLEEPLSLYKGKLEYTAYYAGEDKGRDPQPDVVLLTDDPNDSLFYKHTDQNFPAETSRTFVVPLYEDGWYDLFQQPVSREKFLATLHALNTIKVKAKYTNGVETENRLSAVSIDKAVLNQKVDFGYNGYPVYEQCSCPSYHHGSWCQECGEGHRKGMTSLYTVLCQLESRRCPHNRVGEHCECPVGYYVDVYDNCVPCLCPVDASYDGRERVSCSLSNTGDVVCHNCPTGTTGAHCDKCLPGYQGNPNEYGGRCTYVDDSEILRPPVIEPSYDDDNRSQNLGDSIYMDCLVRGQGDVRVDWTRSGDKGIPYERSYIYPNNTLQIRDLKKEDEGLYVCTASNIYGVNTKHYLITFYTDPTPELEITTNPNNPEEGKSFALICNHKNAGPGYVVDWSREDGVIDRNVVVAYGDTLYFHSLLLSDSGKYKCSVETLTGPVSKYISINVIPKIVTETIIESGKSITVDCVIFNPNPVRVYWMKNGGSDLGPRTTIFANHTLHINDFSSEDEGIYACVVVNRDGSIKSFATKFTLNEEINQNVQTITAGQRFHAHCYKENDQVYSVIWTKNGDRELGLRARVIDQYELEITDIKPEDSGRYVCKVTYIQGHATESIIDVRVQSVLKPRVEVGADRLLLTVGSRMFLTCLIDCEAHFSYKWTKNGQDIWDSRIQIDDSQKTLSIDNIQYDDRGLYVCEAENEFGRDQKIVNVEVIDQPNVIDLAPRYDIQAGETLTLQCRADGLQNYRLQWLKNGNSYLGARAYVRDYELTIQNMEFEDGGTYTCRFIDMANNNIFFDQRTEVFVQSHKGPKINGNALRLQRLNQFDDTTLNCVVTSEYSFQVQWYKDGKRLEEQFTRINEDYSLVLTNVQPHHSGQYVCNAYNQYGSVNHTINLIVEETYDYQLKEGLYTHIEEPVRKSANINDYVRLKCYFLLEDKDAYYIWTRRDGTDFSNEYPRIIDEGSGYLEIQNVQIEDEGVYVCNAHYDDDKLDTAESYLAVRGGNGPSERENAASNVVIRIHPEKQTARVGERVTISCDVDSDVPFTPIINWKNAYTNSLPSNHQTIGNQLIFNNVGYEHAGLYECTVKTPVGFVNAYSSLEVSDHQQENIETVDVNEGSRSIQAGQSIYLRCSHPEKNDRIRVYFESPNDEFLAEGYGEVVYLLREANQQNSGMYTCIIEDPYLPSPKLFVYIRVEEIIYVPQPDGGNEYGYLKLEPQSASAKVGSSFDFNCYGDQDAYDYSWFKLSEDLRWLPVDDPSIQQSENRLHFGEVQSYHSGSYRCTAYNRRTGGQLEAQAMLGVTGFATFPEVVIHPEFAEVYEGESTLLTCESNTPDAEYYWRREDDRPLPQNSLVQEGQLYFQNVRVDDAGKYHCSVRTAVGTAETAVELLVNSLVGNNRETAGFNYQVSIYPDSSRVSAGDTAVFTCSVTGSTEFTPDISWRNQRTNSLPVDSQLAGDKLIISNVKPEDEGYYECTAKVRGLSASAVAHLAVKVENNYEISIEPQPAYAEYGSEFHLTCRGGQGSPVYTWSKLQEDQTWVPVEVLFEDTYVNENELHFYNVQPEHQGSYKCQIYNLETGQFDSAIATLEVLVAGSGRDVRSVETQYKDARVGDLVEMDCVVGGSC